MPDPDVQDNRPEGGESAAPQDLYDQQMQDYREAMQSGQDFASRRFGFVLFHSLPGEQAVALRQKMGFQPAANTDYYNLGVVAAQAGNYAEGIAQFRKVLEIDPEFSEAEYNLALALELSGDVAAAKKQWASYIKRESITEADRTAVTEHVKELG